MRDFCVFLKNLNPVGGWLSLFMVAVLINFAGHYWLSNMHWSLSAAAILIVAALWPCKFDYAGYKRDGGRSDFV